MHPTASRRAVHPPKSECLHQCTGLVQMHREFHPASGHLAEGVGIRSGTPKPSVTFGKRYNLTGADCFTSEGYVDTFAEVLDVPAEKVFVPAGLMDDLFAGWAAREFGAENSLSFAPERKAVALAAVQRFINTNRAQTFFYL